MAGDGMRDRDLVLPPGQQAYVLDETKGRVSAYVGPFKASLSNTDQLVLWDGEMFRAEDDPRLAIQSFVRAGEGQYVILDDPATNGASHHPTIGTSNDAVELDAGRKVVIPGPCEFPLWPRQSGQVVNGHHLKSNQYLVVRVYDPEAAQKNASSAVVATAEGGGGEETEGKTTRKKTVAPKSKNPLANEDLTIMGKLIVIRGTDLSFFIPPTGIEVIPEGSDYVREAATLERLEYCILLNEDGEKRYVRGPAVVFPEPTETFITNADGEPKAKAIELNAQSGLYIKAIADYEHEEEFNLDALRGGGLAEVSPGETVKEGDELFITGKHTPIYFPRPEHMLLMYRQQRKHHAIAIPRGEGRYMLDRATGEVKLITGPKMFLPDPRQEVVVQRILDADDVKSMYPGNEDALRINLEMANQQANLDNVLANQQMASDQEAMKTMATPPPGQIEGATYASFAAASLMPEAASAEQVMRSSTSSGGGRQGRRRQPKDLGESASRGTKFTKPRTIVLDTKYQGAVEVAPWSGYAVLITNRAGDRRVEVGPKSILLEYDETLMKLSLSTGRPKNDARVLRTPYLCTVNNQVSDQVVVETSDLVQVTLTLSYRVNFEGEDQSKWFDIENYVQLLTDHCRSRLRNQAKRHKISDFHSKYIDITRDCLLGKAKDGKRDGLFFAENNMRVYDVEVLGAEIRDSEVGHLLAQAAMTTMTETVRLQQAEDEATRERRMQELTRQRIDDEELTSDKAAQAALAELERTLEHSLRQVNTDIQVGEEETKVRELELANSRMSFEQGLELQTKLDHAELDRETAETDLVVKRANAVKGGFAEALAIYSDKALMQEILESIGPVALASGVNIADLMAQLLKGTQFGDLMSTFAKRPYANGHQLAESGATATN